MFISRIYIAMLLLAAVVCVVLLVESAQVRAPIVTFAFAVFFTGIMLTVGWLLRQNPELHERRQSEIHLFGPESTS